MKKLFFFLSLSFLFVSLVLPTFVQARSKPTEPVYRTLDELINDFRRDLQILTQFSRKSSVVEMTVSERLGEDIKNYALSKIEALPSIAKIDFQFIQCKDCFALRAEKEGDQIRVTKGVNSKEELVQLVDKLGVDSYTEVRITYSGFSLRLHINMYKLSGSELLWGKTYSTRLVTLGQSKIHFAFSYNQAFGEKKSQPWGGEFFIAERIYGLGSFGISSMYLSKHRAYYSYITLAPTMELSINDMFNKHFPWGDIRLVLKVGFGLYNSKRSFSGGGGIKVKYGNIIYTSLQWVGTIQESEDEFSAEEVDEEVDEDVIDLSLLRKNKFPYTMILSLGFDFD